MFTEEALAGMVAEKRSVIGRRYYYDLVLMNGEVRRLEGVVDERRGVIALYYEWLSASFADACWNTARRHYPWVESKPTQ